ncbi:MAG: M20/M25/M40 family metallo-hydrolase [Verrucomicrobiota bacterium]
MDPDAIARHLSEILSHLPATQQQVRGIKEILLANLVMIAEKPAPTFEERDRLNFVAQRFTESHLQNISIDEAGNAQGIIPGSESEDFLLLMAHADVPAVPGEAPTALQVVPDRISGPGVADNSLGLAAITTFPEILKILNIQLKSNLVLLGASKSLGEGDLRGINFFLDNFKYPIKAGLCVEGVHLGRLSYSCLGVVRGEIECQLPESRLEWNDSSNAIVVLHDIIQRILAIPVPSHPRTEIILGSIRSGNTYNRAPKSGSVRFEVRSEQVGMARSIRYRIAEIAEEVAARSHCEVDVRLIARRRPGGIPFSHPLVQASRAILESLEVKPRVSPSMGDLSALISRQIPGVTLGITQGENLHEAQEDILIEPIFTGLAQLIGILQAIDAGVIDPTLADKESDPLAEINDTL